MRTNCARCCLKPNNLGGPIGLRLTKSARTINSCIIHITNITICIYLYIALRFKHNKNKPILSIIMRLCAISAAHNVLGFCLAVGCYCGPKYEPLKFAVFQIFNSNRYWGNVFSNWVRRVTRASGIFFFLVHFCWQSLWNWLFDMNKILRTLQTYFSYFISLFFREKWIF